MNSLSLRTHSGSRSATHGLLGRLVDRLARGIAGWLYERGIRRDMEQLQAMSDAQLKDIGVGRGEIESVTRGYYDPRG